MATFTSYTQVGAKEDVSDVISMLTPHKTPFSTSIGEGTVRQKIYQWQEDALDLGADNAQIEGFDANDEDIGVTTMRQNTTQILSRTIRISGSAEATDTYGRASELARALMKKGKSLRLDLERANVGVVQAMVAGNNATARRFASALSQVDASAIITNTGSTQGAPTALDEATLQAAIRKAYDLGSTEAETLMVKPTDAERISVFAGTATRQRDVTNSTKVLVKVDVYTTALGTLRVVVNREIKSDHALLYDPSMWTQVKLKGRGWFRETLAKTGDSTKIMLAGEYGLKHANYKGAVLIRYLAA